MPVSTITGCHRKWGVLEGEKSDCFICGFFFLNQTRKQCAVFDRDECPVFSLCMNLYVLSTSSFLPDMG